MEGTRQRGTPHSQELNDAIDAVQNPQTGLVARLTSKYETMKAPCHFHWSAKLLVATWCAQRVADLRVGWLIVVGGMLARDAAQTVSVWVVTLKRLPLATLCLDVAL